MATKKGKATVGQLRKLLEKGATSAFALMRGLDAPAYIVAKLLLELHFAGKNSPAAAPVSRARKVKASGTPVTHD